MKCPECMEMPTPCEKCGDIFELLDGLTSEKWFPNTIICESCGQKEKEEIERDEEIEELKDRISDAEITIRYAKERLKELESNEAI